MTVHWTARRSNQSILKETNPEYSQLRNIIDKNKKYYQNSYDYIIIIKNEYVGLDFKSKNDEFVYLINKINKEI